MVKNEHLGVSRKKRLLILLMVTVFVFLCYIRITKYNDIKLLFWNTSTELDTNSVDEHWLNYKQKESIFSFRQQKWRQTSIYEIFDKYKYQTSENCVNFCDVENDLACAASSFEDLDKAMWSTNLTFKPLLSEFEYVYPFEVDYLSYPPMTDSADLPSFKLSKVYLKGSSNGEVLCAIGETLKGRVDLVDGRGKQRNIGGDIVRVWIQDKQTKGYRAAGSVIDLRNGSYQISVRCLWPGKSQLYVAVAYPREFIRVVIQQSHLGVTWLFMAKFKKAGIEEITLCSATPNIPGRSCICNFTSFNHMSMYCGRPIDSRLTCADWKETASALAPIPHNVTPAEKLLIEEMPRLAYKNHIQHNITIVVENKGQLPKLKPCAQTNIASTWDIDLQPTGYWTPKKDWQSLICERPKITQEWTTFCLKNSNVWIYGDSNGILLLNALSRMTKISNMSFSPPYTVTNYDRLHAINMTMTPYEYPYFRYKKFMIPMPHGSVAQRIDNIPSNGTYFVVIHYYLHLAPSHLSAVYLRWKATHDAVQRLLSRNPNVLVAIRGPHVGSVDLKHNHAVGGDNLGLYWLEMIRYIFADLRHKVIFLDGWEMTIALENPLYHPDNCVPEQLLRTMLAFKCS